MRYKPLILAAGLGILTLAGPAYGSMVWWTPAHMVKALTVLQYPRAGTTGGVCTGLSKPHHGGYAGFRCRMVWQVNAGAATTSGTQTVWVRPLVHGRVCGSTLSLAACRPLKAGPLAGDPRLCPLDDPARCAESAAELAARQHVGGPGGLWQGPSFTCTLTGPLKYSCTLDQTYTVAFTKGVSQWNVTVTP
jgi:hypothetical protein